MNTKKTSLQFSEQKIKVSVVIPCYNYGRYLVDCIDSVLAQTYNDLEIIVVNDGSTDDSSQIIRPYLANSRLTYIEQKNAGQPTARNVGIAHSQGDFIAFLDADDMWVSSKLARQMPLFERPEIGVVYSRSRYIDVNGQPLKNKIDCKYLRPRAGRVTKYLLFDNFVPFSSSVFRKSCLVDLGGFDESLTMGDDWDIMLRMSVQYRFDYIDEPLVLYRSGHSGQLSKNLEGRQINADKIMNKFMRKYPEEITWLNRRRSLAYTYYSRGEYTTPVDLAKSNSLYLASIKAWPFWFSSYKALVRNFIRR